MLALNSSCKSVASSPHTISNEESDCMYLLLSYKNLLFIQVLKVFGLSLACVAN